MRVSWMERITNAWVLENMKPELTLRSRVAQAALRYYGNVVREECQMKYRSTQHVDIVVPTVGVAHTCIVGNRLRLH